ncbi:MAG: helix-turn-helix transcriptional regulator [Opitutales bacterium]|nr:helix-turn-helix transcriptional regulator [Opitutales bacterium]MBT5169180.1 helix-turn-helix transcriptional regulator [Opitutales bacterium]MBT5814482.1 helix-turn-helix transcriptional regulator [Opitutales bacterium]
MGESVGRYLRRRRIAEAAQRLTEYEGRVLELAFDFQFESHESFTRAFKAELSMTPSEWRDGTGHRVALRRPECLTQENLNQRYMNIILTPIIEYRDPASFIGVEGSFISAMSEEANNMFIILKLWDEYMNRISEIPSWELGVSYGLAHDLEVHGRTRTHDDETLYLAASKVEQGSGVPTGMKNTILKNQNSW